MIDLNQPVLYVFAAGTATYTNNPQIPLHIDYTDALSHRWFAGGNNAAVFICQRRDRPCTNADQHNYTAACSVANLTRLAAPGNQKQNSFDCSYDLSGTPDGPVHLRASAADQSIPDPDPTADESHLIFPSHVNQFINPATGSGWTASSANLANSSCGSVILDRVAPAVSAHPSDANPATVDLVTFSASATDAVSGIAGPLTWDFGDNTPTKQGANITHTYGSPGTYRVTLTAHDGAGNEGTDAANLVVKTVGGTGGGGTVVTKPPDNTAIGGSGGTQKSSVGALTVIAPKKHKLSRKPKVKFVRQGPTHKRAAQDVVAPEGPVNVDSGPALSLSP